MHPVGPEPQETYWVRRAVVIGSALVLMIILLLVLFNLNGSQQPAPAAPPNPLPSLTPMTPSASPSSASPSPSGSASASASASGKATPSASASGKASSSASASASASGSPKAAGKASSSPSTKSTSTAVTQQTLTVCDPSDLDLSVDSPRTAGVSSSVGFKLSLTNTGSNTCVVTVNPNDFSLKLVSGSDRIWSTADCSTLVGQRLAQLTPKQSLNWTVEWNGKRSASGCKTRPGTPGAGYYWATASFTGVASDRARLILN